MKADFIRGLRLSGMDVISALDADMVNQLDDEHLRVATDAGRVLYSFNIRDYAKIHARWADSGMDHAGIILAKQRKYSVSAQIARVLFPAASVTPESMRNRLEFLQALSVRCVTVARCLL